MKVSAQTQIGKNIYTFEAEEQKEMESIHKVVVLSNPRRKCNLCDNKEWYKLISNKDKEGHCYVNILCKCGAKSKLGQYMSGGYFWREFEMYTKKPKQTTSDPQFIIDDQDYTPEEPPDGE